MGFKTNKQHKLFWGYTLIIRCGTILLWLLQIVIGVKKNTKHTKHGSKRLYRISAQKIVNISGMLQWKVIGKEKPYLSTKGQLVMYGVKITPDGKVEKEPTKTVTYLSGNQTTPTQTIMGTCESTDWSLKITLGDICYQKKQYII